MSLSSVLICYETHCLLRQRIQLFLKESLYFFIFWIITVQKKSLSHSLSLHLLPCISLLKKGWINIEITFFNLLLKTWLQDKVVTKFVWDSLTIFMAVSLTEQKKQGYEWRQPQVSKEEKAGWLALRTIRSRLLSGKNPQWTMTNWLAPLTCGMASGSLSR